MNPGLKGRKKAITDWETGSLGVEIKLNCHCFPQKHPGQSKGDLPSSQPLHFDTALKSTALEGLGESHTGSKEKGDENSSHNE